MLIIRADGSYKFVGPGPPMALVHREIGAEVTMMNAGKFIGFVMEDTTKGEDNVLASQVLEFLGNNLRCFVDDTVRGPLAIMGRANKDLKPEHIAAFEELCEHFKTGEPEDIQNTTLCLFPPPLDLDGDSRVERTRKKKRKTPYDK